MAMTRKFSLQTKIGRIMELLARQEGATLDEVKEAWGDDKANDAFIIQQVLRGHLVVRNKVRLEVDLRQQRVRCADFVRFDKRIDLGDLVLKGYATETRFDDHIISISRARNG